MVRDVMGLAAVAALGLTLSLGAYGADENRTKEVSVSVKNENKVIKVEGARDSTTVDPTVQRVRMKVTDGTISEIKNPKCNQNATWTLTDGGLGKRNVEWLERLPEKPDAGAYYTKFENETLMDGGEGNGEPKKYKWAAEENHNIYNATVAIDKTAQYIYANATGAVPVTFTVRGMGDAVRIGWVDLIFTLGNGEVINIHKAPFADGDGFRGLTDQVNGEDKQYTAWAKIQNFRNIVKFGKDKTLASKIFNNKVKVILYNVEPTSKVSKGKSKLPSPSQTSENQDDKGVTLTSKEMEIIAYCDERVFVAELGSKDHAIAPLSLNEFPKREFRHIASNPSSINNLVLPVACQKFNFPFPHICGTIIGNKKCEAPYFTNHPRQGFDVCTNTATMNDQTISLTTVLEDDRDFSFSLDGQTIAAENYGAVIGTTFDFSYRTREVEVLGDGKTGMVVAENSKTVNIDMFTDGFYSIGVSGCPNLWAHDLPDTGDAILDIIASLAGGGVGAFVGLSKVLYDQFAAYLDIINATNYAAASVEAYRIVHKAGTSNTKTKVRLFEPKRIHNDGFDADSIDLNQNISAEVGTTHTCYVSVNAVSKATSNLFLSQSVSARASFDANFAVSVVIKTE